MLEAPRAWMAVACIAGFAQACIGAAGEGVSAVDDGAGADALTSSVPIGSTLKTTGNLNLRAGPSTSESVLHVMPKGATVVTVNTDTPSHGFYNVTDGGVEGWASGKYLQLIASPDGGGSGGGSGGSEGGGGGSGGSIWTPAPGTTWQWQLTSPVDTSIDASVFDIDLFDNDSAVVAQLHAAGRKVICYVSAGSYENWRPDASKFPSSVLGNDYSGWTGEKWLDIRDIAALAPIMRARMDLCAQKGFDGLEPDNIDGYTNNTGFALTAADQIAYNSWLAGEAHARGLSIGLKNDADQTPDLVGSFDWALTEDCAAQSWCDGIEPFVKQGKAVFMAEYTDTGAKTSVFCSTAASLGLSGILKHRSLDAWVQRVPVT